MLRVGDLARSKILYQKFYKETPPIVKIVEIRKDAIPNIELWKEEYPDYENFPMYVVDDVAVLSHVCVPSQDFEFISREPIKRFMD